MAMVSNLCQKGILFESGKLKYQGPISGAVLEYYQSTNAATNANSFESDSAVLLNAEIIGAGQHNELSIHDSIALNMRYRLKKNINGVSVPNFHFFSADGSCIFISNARDCKQLPAGEYIAQCMIPSNLLNEGTYFVGVALTTYYENAPLTVEFFDRNAVTFNVIDPMDELSFRYGYMGAIPGFLRPKLDWKITKVVS
jgi:lipopolysaccharide transport system ATP-binding protein